MMNVVRLRDYRRLAARGAKVYITGPRGCCSLDCYMKHDRARKKRVAISLEMPIHDHIAYYITDGEWPPAGTAQISRMIPLSTARIDQLISLLGPDWTGQQAEPDEDEEESQDAEQPAAAQDETSESAGQTQRDEDEDMEAAACGSEPESSHAHIEHDDQAEAEMPGDESEDCVTDSSSEPNAESSENDHAGSSDLTETPGDSTSTESLQPRNVFGGLFDDIERAKLLAVAERKSARNVVRALRRLIRAYEFGIEDVSPRMDGRRLVRELVARRANLQRTLRRECDLPLVLLLCDVSGSCSAACTMTLAACLAIANELPNVECVRHSNGLVVSSHGETRQYITDLVKADRRRIGLVVAFGDWDAGDEYRYLCESGAKLVWLDSYCAKYEVRPASSALRAPAAEWKAQPIAWFQGVNSAKSAEVALMQCVPQ